jgi:diaminopimelate epimerase
MLVNFTKMHGLGNDFVVIELLTQQVRLHTTHIKRIADRHLGIGCDQVLVIEPPTRKSGDFYYRIFNADGEEVEQCGNGARCAARFFYELGFTENKLLLADCLAGPMEFQIQEGGLVTVNMGHPRFAPAAIPFLTDKESLTYSLSLSANDDKEIEFSTVSMGNPHAVILTQNITDISLKSLGAKLAKHPLFPNGINVELMKIVNRNHIQLRVYERGVGETNACGTGACAAAVVGIKRNLLDSPVTVSFKHGDLVIEWLGEGQPVSLTGPTHTVFVGHFLL